jgi:hypothetical protein
MTWHRSHSLLSLAIVSVMIFLVINYIVVELVLLLLVVNYIMDLMRRVILVLSLIFVLYSLLVWRLPVLGGNQNRH